MAFNVRVWDPYSHHGIPVGAPMGATATVDEPTSSATKAEIAEWLGAHGTDVDPDDHTKAELLGMVSSAK